MNNYKITNILDKVLQWVLIAVTVTPLIFYKYFYYPFITGKVLFFRVLVLLGLLAWVVLVFLKKRIKFCTSPIWRVFLLLVMIMFLAAIFGVNFTRSFWGNIERAEGVVFWLFLLIYFSLLLYALKDIKMWRWFFRISLAVGIIVIGYGLLQDFGLLSAISTTGSRVSSTLGNPAYMGSYTLMHFFIALYLIIKDKKIVWKIFYGLAIALNLWAIFLTQTRGAVIGLLLGLLVWGGLSVFRGKNRQIKKLGAVGLVSLIILSLGAYFLRNTNLIQSNDTLKRVTSISLESYTVQTRLAAWRTSLEAFKTRPILGWGPENYGYAFSKYFPPEIYVESGSRIWFDKAHNVFFEFLVTTGVSGVVLYFGLIFLAIYYLFRSKRISVVTSNIFIALLLGHLTANMFVFDSVSTYILWLAVLAFIINIAGKGEEKEIEFKSGFKIILSLVVILLLYVSYVTNVLAMGQIRNLLYAEAYARDGQTEESYNFYLKALENNNSFTRFEITRELAVFVRNSAGSLPNYQAGPMYDKAIEEVKKSIDMDPEEIRHYYNLSQLYLKSYKIDSSRLQKVIDLGPKMIELAPRRAHTYYQIGEAYVLLKEYDQALENFQKAVELNPKVIDTYVNVYAVALLKGDQQLEETTRQKMELVEPDFFELESTLVRYLPLYKKAGREDLLAAALDKLIKINPEKVEYTSSLAIFYAEKGENKKAEEVIKTLLGRNAELDKQVDDFVKKIYNKEFKK